MADSSAPVSSAAQPNAVPGTAPAADNALPKNPLAEAPADKPAEATSTSVAGAVPLPLAPETTKQGDAPATEASGKTDAPASNSNGVNGTTAGAKFEPVVPEEKKADTAAPAPAVENPASSAAVPGESASESTAPAQTPVMTGALGASEPKPAEATNDDGVKDATAAPKPAELNGANEKDVDKDVEMKDSAAAAPAPAIPAASSAAPAAPQKTAPAPAATTDPDSNIEASTTTAETGEKRKVEATGTNGATAAGEPAEKKQKQGVVGKVVEKAKEVVEEVKEKAEGGAKKENGPTRKASKKGKKEAAPPPVGRTARKTRSQGNAD
ncbi:hypothetical protein INS49_000339 [Diaporthe citri]|uniref:uncharacterized protein n=1 Tax=Diaporthe citri TaxID=83186 RepID=UPI001C82143D|nr:uncharacterized protein INS49_000339 [Diaporthe citri]KAG6366163.1 hypothetical protein INS49_000339 [Diaporthe citri]